MSASPIMSCLFGLLVERIGLVPILAVTLILSRAAAPQARSLELLGLIAVVSVDSRHTLLNESQVSSKVSGKLALVPPHCFTSHSAIFERSLFSRHC